jgi:transposase
VGKRGPRQHAQKNLKRRQKKRFALLKNPENLTQTQQAQLELVTKSDPELYKAYLLKERLRLLFKFDNIYTQFYALGNWIYLAEHSKIPEMIALSEKVRRNKAHIRATLKHGLSSGKLEATNNIIKSIIRRSFGFRNTDNLISMIYLRTAPWLAYLEDCMFNAIG